MTILIDDRGGAKGVSGYPTQLHALLPDSLLTRLDAGDIAFSGVCGTVGIELKRVTDALSCMYSSRLADVQLPRMREHYDVRYLVIEEPYRAEPGTGVLQRWKTFPSSKKTIVGRWYDAHAGKNRVTFQAFQMWLTTLTMQGQATLLRTGTLEETADLIKALYCWWQRDDHRSMMVMHWDEGDSAVLSRPTMLRRILALLPNVGWHRSGILCKRFSSVAEMVAAPPEAWLIERQIAMPTALKIVAALRGAE